jgi:pimeloyl-ACP methyl ester carboxylesterase
MKLKLFHFLILLVIIGVIQIPFYKEKTNSKFLELPQGNLAYKEYGSGENILVLIHGSPGDKDDFSLLAPAIKNYKIYALDMYGFGVSEKSVKNYGIDVQADAISNFIDAINKTKISILGYSWGGSVAITFAYKYPEKTDKLILLSSSGVQEGEYTGNYIFEKSRMYFSYPFVVYYPGVFGGSIGWRRGFIRSFIDTDMRKIEQELQNINAQTLILHGKNDLIVEPWVAEKTRSLIDDSTIVFYDGGHGQLHTNVSFISSQINNFLASSKSKGKLALVVEG